MVFSDYNNNTQLLSVQLLNRYRNGTVLVQLEYFCVNLILIDVSHQANYNRVEENIAHLSHDYERN